MHNSASSGGVAGTFGQGAVLVQGMEGLSECLKLRLSAALNFDDSKLT